LPENVAIGESLPIVKRGEVVASGWNDALFAVAPNESVEIGTRRLLPYCRRENLSHVPEELHASHALVADELEGVIDVVMSIERELTVEMFHSDEANEEAILFANGRTSACTTRSSRCATRLRSARSRGC
jgi:hypothetical protein